MNVSLYTLFLNDVLVIERGKSLLYTDILVTAEKHDW